MTVKAGQSARLDVKIGGEPAPDVLWTKNDKTSLTATKEMTIETKKQEKTVLTILKSKRGDCGKYTIKVKNNLGDQSADINLTVLGTNFSLKSFKLIIIFLRFPDKPTPPKGPLEVKNVFEDNCILEWQPPDDDGGEPIECYEIEKMDSATGRWVPAGRSKDPKFHVLP